MNLDLMTFMYHLTIGMFQKSCGDPEMTSGGRLPDTDSDQI
jgi:hypothetical protein